MKNTETQTTRESFKSEYLNQEYPNVDRKGLGTQTGDKLWRKGHFHMAGSTFLEEVSKEEMAELRPLYDELCAKLKMYFTKPAGAPEYPPGISTEDLHIVRLHLEDRIYTKEQMDFLLNEVLPNHEGDDPRWCFYFSNGEKLASLILDYAEAYDTYKPLDPDFTKLRKHQKGFRCTAPHDLHRLAGMHKKELGSNSDDSSLAELHYSTDRGELTPA